MVKRRIRIVVPAALLLGSLGCTSTYYQETHRTVTYRQVHRTTSADVSMFYRELERHGHWFLYGSHGWAWTPYDVPYGWRPYSHGRWVYAECGWTWMSEEPWGWAAYHYGRWLFDAGYGWIWIPDTVWAPAWVVWRWSDDWIGWAPLPPGVAWRAGAGLQFGDPDPYGQLDGPTWCFVRRTWFLEPELHGRLVAPPRNVPLLAMTRIVADYDEFDGRPRNKGIGLEEIQRSLRKPVPRVMVMDAGSPREAGRMTKGRELQVYRPQIASKAETPPAVTPGRVDRPVPETVLQASREKEQRRIESAFERQQRRIESEQRKELRDVEPGSDVAALRKRHDEERRGLEEQKQRELKVLEQRLEKRIVKPTGKAKSEGNTPTE